MNTAVSNDTSLNRAALVFWTGPFEAVQRGSSGEVLREPWRSSEGWFPRFFSAWTRPGENMRSRTTGKPICWRVARI
jgi:hypothetical protein